jgi:hypothetical protein
MDEGFHYYRVNVDGATLMIPEQDFSTAHNAGKAV